MKRPPLKIFYSYSHEDEQARDRLDEHLELLARRNLVVRWHDRHIVPGHEWNEAIQTALSDADIILLLISKAFLDSEYVQDHEIPEAMAEHVAGRARVVPILLEEIDDWQGAAFAKLELLPAKGKAVSLWKDPVKAYANIARGIERVTKDIIVAGGGPFEFGAHEFTEAELGQLSKGARSRCLEGLRRLRLALNDQIPTRRYEKNVLMANWTLSKFGALKHERLLPEALYFMAQTISAFDLVALQEVSRNLDLLRRLLNILGPDWSYLATDIAPGSMGNNERFAFLYYKPRIEFGNISSNLTLSSDTQLVRPPLMSAFKSAEWTFEVCTSHIIYGGGPNNMPKRLAEIDELLTHLKWRSRGHDKDLFLLGDFQLESRDSRVHKALVTGGVEIPDAILKPASAFSDRQYSLIGYLSESRRMPLTKGQSAGGVFRIFDYALRTEDCSEYSKTGVYREMTARLAEQRGRRPSDETTRQRQFQRWRTTQISDHFPLWVQLEVPKIRRASGA